MNYLAHLHLADLSHTSLAGALLGEYARGALNPALPVALQTGILLHRRIDSFTDAHPLHAGRVRALPSPFRRFGGIITDMMFDHFLARHWPRFHAQPLEAFVQQAHAELQPDRHWPEAMVLLVSRMKQNRLLLHYREFDGIITALSRIDRRFKCPTPLPYCRSLLEQYYHDMETAFLGFYPELEKFVLNEAELVKETTRPTRR
ncbi:ACP phosphodiesterase [Oceanimonas sp. CHS3-5]|uniref:acyl carrier protein phosphodiesterase n=1 Tax=Oceanimonas sp. CHS3-5 TaxID=3068186 RepID=UPI00273E0526|nr:ACP phosphodiesterase [Oceanimonas sp. CHS3-5]MDP5292727.1 ACP phosphodiesterase [Oceanimonas sp. CHS3-5]